jgi:predicted amidohydrolase YtcJ
MTRPDMVFVGGTVVTVDAADRLAGGVAVRDGRIVAVGEGREVAGLAGPGTRVVDLAGGAVLPGINDSHLHAAMLGAYWPNTWLAGFASGGGLPVPRELRTEADRRSALRRAWDVLLPLGITGYTEPGLGPGADGQHGGACGADVLATYEAMAVAGELPVRVTALLLFGELDGPGEPGDLERGLRELPRVRTADPRWWRVAGVKLFADGIPPMRTAWMAEPYAGGGRGRPITTGGDDGERLGKLLAMVDHAHRAGHQVGVHATGSAAVAAMAGALAEAMARDGRRDARHYVIHGDCASPEALRAMAGAGIGLNSQPTIYTATRGLLAEALGPGRAAETFPLRAALDAGVRLCLSSDGPVTAPDWRVSVADAASRVEDGADRRIAVSEAIRAYTATPAWQDRAESWKGSIEVGKVADLCVLAADPLTTPPADIPGIEVVMTVIDGRIRYER